MIPMPVGTLNIEVTFEINGNGMLGLWATDKFGKYYGLTISRNKYGRLSNVEIEDMIKNAKGICDED